MAFNPPPTLLEKVMRFRAIQHKDGKVLLHGIPVLLALFSSNAYQQRLLEHLYGKKAACEVIYGIGKFQAGQGTKIINKRFGYADKIKDIKKIMEFNLNQTEVVGAGKLKWIKVDFDNQIFIVKGDSTFAREYKKLFGLTSYPVDYFLGGCIAGGLEVVLNKKMFCDEIKCIAQGDPTCIFIIRPVEKWDKKILKKRFIEDIPSLKELGAKLPCLY